MSSCWFRCPVSPALSEPLLPHTPGQLSLRTEQPALVTSSSAHQPSLGSFVCCDRWLRRYVFFTFPFVDKPFILVCVVDWCWEPKWHAWWQGDPCSDELPALLSSPRTCVCVCVCGRCHTLVIWRLLGFIPPKETQNHFWLTLFFPDFFPFV